MRIEEVEEHGEDSNSEEGPYDPMYRTEMVIDYIALKDGNAIYHLEGAPNGFMRNAMGGIDGITMTDRMLNRRVVIPWSSINYIMETGGGAAEQV